MAQGNHVALVTSASNLEVDSQVAKRTLLLYMALIYLSIELLTSP
jgi:hypothetical protein